MTGSLLFGAQEVSCLAVNLLKMDYRFVLSVVQENNASTDWLKYGVNILCLAKQNILASLAIVL